MKRIKMSGYRYDLSSDYGGGGGGGGYRSYYSRPQTLADHYERHAEERAAQQRASQMRRELCIEEEDDDYYQRTAPSVESGRERGSGAGQSTNNGLAIGNWAPEEETGPADGQKQRFGAASKSSRSYTSGAPPAPPDEIGHLLKHLDFDPSLRGLVTGLYGRPRYDAVPQPKLSSKPFVPEEHSWERPMHSTTAEDPREQTINRAAQALLEASRPPPVPIKDTHVPAIETIAHRKPAWKIEEELKEMADEIQNQPAPLKKGYNPETEKKKLQVMFTFKGGKALPDSALPEAVPGQVPLHLITGKRAGGGGSSAGGRRGAGPRSKEDIVAALGLPASEAKLLMVATQDELTLVAEAQATLREVKESIVDLKRHLSELSSIGAVDGGYLRGVEGDLADKTREMTRINHLVADVRTRLIERAEAHDKHEKAMAAKAAAAAGSSGSRGGGAAAGGKAAGAGRGPTRNLYQQQNQYDDGDGAGPVAGSDALDSHLERHYFNSRPDSGYSRPGSGASSSYPSNPSAGAVGGGGRQQQQQQQMSSSRGAAASAGASAGRTSAGGSSKPPIPTAAAATSAGGGRGRGSAAVGMVEPPSFSGPVGVSMSRVGGSGPEGRAGGVGGGGVVVAGPEGRARMTVVGGSTATGGGRSGGASGGAAGGGPRTRISPSPLRMPPHPRR